MAREQRRKIVVDPRLQWRLLRDVCTVPLASLAGGALIVFLLLRMVRAEAATHDAVMPSLDELTAAVVLFVVACAAITVYHALRVSHRIAGPLYRLRAIMNSVLAGETVATAGLRRGDYMHDTVEQFNRVVALLADRDREIAHLRARAREDDRAPADATR